MPAQCHWYMKGWEGCSCTAYGCQFCIVSLYWAYLKRMIFNPHIVVLSCAKTCTNICSSREYMALWNILFFLFFGSCLMPTFLHFMHSVCVKITFYNTSMPETQQHCYSSKRCVIGPLLAHGVTLLCSTHVYPSSSSCMCSNFSLRLYMWHDTRILLQGHNMTVFYAYLEAIARWCIGKGDYQAWGGG